MATGGPAGIYADSVYPECHTGTTSLALLAGASAQNLTEWQYGLASIAPRWNVSGTYMQVLPRFVSIDENGTEYEFLADYFADPYEALSAVFLKGYQWPFDSKKVLHGSSVVDLLVYRECVLKKRRVYLDFTKNPFALDEIDYTTLSPEAYDYLRKADACFGKPIDRLFKMNTPAVSLYAGKGLDITKQYLEIALCAQHNNGGVAVDLWWQTSVKGLFAACQSSEIYFLTLEEKKLIVETTIKAARGRVPVIASGHTSDAISNQVKELTAMAEELYGQLFEDEGHFLLVFCDDGFGSYNCGYAVGAQAKPAVSVYVRPSA